VSYCDQCGFYYNANHCTVCDAGEIRDTRGPAVLSLEEQRSYPARWLALVILFGLTIVLAVNSVIMGLSLGSVVPYCIAVSLFALLLNWEIQSLAEMDDELVEWSPNLSAWRRISLGIVVSGGVVGLVAMPYYLYMRAVYVSFKEKTG